MDYEDCEHNCGTYIDKEDMSQKTPVKRCNCCDIVMNFSREEYDDDF